MMQFLKLSILYVAMGISLAPYSMEKDFPSGYSATSKKNPLRIDSSKGYRGIVQSNDGFIAAGSEGRVDWISESGKIIKSQNISGENFNCLLSIDHITFVAGENGSIYKSLDEEDFIPVNCSFNENINTLCFFKGLIIAGADGGIILAGNEHTGFQKISPGLKGNIVSLSSRSNECFGVSDAGEIIHSTDGSRWDIFDFNAVYKGYYKPCYFSSILVTENSIAVAGTKENGLPVIMFSSLGNVWSERELVAKNESGEQVIPEDRPEDIYFDGDRNIFYLLCKNGSILKLPSCSHCNELVQVPARNLAAISGTYDALMIVGEDFFVKRVDLN